MLLWIFETSAFCTRFAMGDSLTELGMLPGSEDFLTEISKLPGREDNCKPIVGPQQCL
jgi:hypothetical protein